MVRSGLLAFAGSVCALAGTASGDQVTFNFSGSIPSGHSASAKFTFDDVAKTLKVRIENTMGAAQNALGSRALTGLFWNMTPSSMPFSGVSATAGAAVNNAGGFAPTQLWAFRGDLTSGQTPFGTQFGLGAAGFDVFGASNMLAPGGSSPQPNGIDGGILSLTGNTYSGQNQNPMFRQFIEFTFQLASPFFAGGLGNIGVTDVGWQFGSGFNEPGIVLVPVPQAALAGAFGLLGVGAWQLARRRAVRAPE